MLKLLILLIRPIDAMQVRMYRITRNKARAQINKAKELRAASKAEFKAESDLHDQVLRIELDAAQANRTHKRNRSIQARLASEGVSDAMTEEAVAFLDN